MSAITSVLPVGQTIHHHSPSFCVDEVEAITEGLYRDPFGTQIILENNLAEYVGTSQVLAVSSGTAALQLALMAAGVRPGEEVLVPTLTFAGTANAVVQAGAIPNFIDSSIRVSSYKLRRYLENTTARQNGKRVNVKTGRAVTALIIVDLLGFPADMERITEVAYEFGLIIIEDAAQALGSSLQGRKCGSFCDAAILSFNNNKIVTGLGGGALLTNDEFLAAKAHQLANTGRIPHKWKIEHDAIGYNYRIPTLSAALVCQQLSRIDEFLAAKVKIRDMYNKALNGCQDAKILISGGGWEGEPNYWLTTLVLEDGSIRDEIFEELTKRGVGARAMFTPLHKLPIYDDFPRQLNMDSSEDLFKRLICLPSGAKLCPKPSSSAEAVLTGAL